MYSSCSTTIFTTSLYTMVDLEVIILLFILYCYF